MAKTLNFKVILEQDNEGYFIASVPAIPGCHTQGETYEQALKNIHEAIKLCLEVAHFSPAYKAKIDFPEAIPQPHFVGITEVPIQLQFA